MVVRTSPLARNIRRTLLALSLGNWLLASNSAWAKPIAYNIQAGSLAAAISQFAATSGVTISFSSQQTAGLQSAGLQGSFELQQGFSRLLQGSGLQVEQVGEKRYVLLKAPQSSSLQLDATSIKSSDLGATSEGSGSYATGSSNSATGLQLSQRETPQSVSVITRQQIEDQNLTDITQVLEQTPGVVVNTYGPPGSDSNAIYVRGFSTNSYQVDGVNRLGTYGFRDDLADMVSYDRVEVVRGATGLMSGFGDPGASINLIRKKPTLQTQRSLTLKAGSWDNYRSELDISGALSSGGDLRGRLVLSKTDSQSHIDRQSLQKHVAYGVLEWDINDSTLLTLGAEYQDLDSDEAGNHGFPLFNSDGSYFKPSRSFNSASDWSYHKRESKTLFTSLEHSFANDWRVKLSAEHSRRSYDDSFATAAGGTVNPDGSGISTWTGRWAAEPKQSSFDLSISGPFTLFSREHQLHLGASHYKAYNRDYGYPLWTIQSIDNIYTWNGSLEQPSALYTKSSKGALDERQTGLVAAARWSLSDSLSLISGARVIDWQRDEVSHYFSAGNVSRSERSETGVITPYLGLIYDLSQNWSAYASYTSIFNPQSYRTVTGSYLDPEEGENYELGIKSEFWNKRLTSALSIFEVHQDNLAVADGSNLAPDGSTAYRAESGTKTRGFEAEIAGELLANWQISASYTYAVIEDSDGKRMNSEIPRDTLKLFTSYRLPSWPQLKVGGGIRWQGDEYYKNSGPNGETAYQDDYTVVDLMAQYALSQSTSISLNLNNLLDENYYSAIGSRAWYGTPRNFTASLSHSF